MAVAHLSPSLRCMHIKLRYSWTAHAYTIFGILVVVKKQHSWQHKADYFYNESTNLDNLLGL